MNDKTMCKQTVDEVRRALLLSIYQHAFWRTRLPIVRRINRLLEMIQRRCWARMDEAERSTALSTALACCYNQKGVDRPHYSRLKGPDRLVSDTKAAENLEEMPNLMEKEISSFVPTERVSEDPRDTVLGKKRKAARKSKPRRKT